MIGENLTSVGEAMATARRQPGGLWTELGRLAVRMRWRAWMVPGRFGGWAVFRAGPRGQTVLLGEFGQKGAAIDSVRAEIAASIARERAARW